MIYNCIFIQLLSKVKCPTISPVMTHAMPRPEAYFLPPKSQISPRNRQFDPISQYRKKNHKNASVPEICRSLGGQIAHRRDNLPVIGKSNPAPRRASAESPASTA